MSADTRSTEVETNIGDSIAITCEYTLADLREAIKRAQRRNVLSVWPFWLVLAGLLAALIGFDYFSTSTRPAPPATQPANLLTDVIEPLLMWLGFIMLAVFGARWVRRRVAARQFERFGPLQRPRTFHLSPAGVIVSEPLSHHQYQWQAFPRWEETRNLFTVYASEASLEIITKRAIGSQAAIERVREMLRSHIDAAKNARQAFPVVQRAAPGKA